MKIYRILLLILVTMTISCAKDQEVELEIDYDKLEYLPNIKENSRVNFILEGNNNSQSAFVLGFSEYSSLSNYADLGIIELQESYIYNSTYSYENLYRESIEVKKDAAGNVFFRNYETHKDIEIEGYKYNIFYDPYELKLLSKDLKLNDTWSNSQILSFTYSKQLSYAPSINNDDIQVNFNYKVIDISDEKTIGSKTYKNVISIKVNYQINNSSLFRIYEFSKGKGLVGFSIGNNHFVIE